MIFVRKKLNIFFGSNHIEVGVNASSILQHS